MTTLAKPQPASSRKRRFRMTPISEPPKFRRFQQVMAPDKDGNLQFGNVEPRRAGRVLNWDYPAEFPKIEWNDDVYGGQYVRDRYGCYRVRFAPEPGNRSGVAVIAHESEVVEC